MASVAPMLLSSTRSTPVGEDWVLEPKWDGFRFLYRLSGDGAATCWTRHANRHDRKLPYIDTELRDLFPDETVLDGELVALGCGPDGVVRHDFDRLRSILATGSAHRPSTQTPALQYVVFDVLELGGEDLRDRTWRERRAALEAAVEAPTDHVSLTETLEPSEQCHERLIAAGFEGSVYKRRSSTYRCGHRSASWLKRKARHQLEVVIRPLITRAGIVERVSCRLPVDDRLVRVGYAEVVQAEVRERLAAQPEAFDGHRGSVVFSSVSARGELREARLVAPDPIPTG
jgi:bifunctional non-homologous end joining protein LigD